MYNGIFRLPDKEMAPAVLVTPGGPDHKGVLVIEQSVASVEESRAERMIRAFMEGAESGMVEVRRYGLTAEEREAAEREAVALYGVSEEAEGSEREAA